MERGRCKMGGQMEEDEMRWVLDGRNDEVGWDEVGR